MRQGLFCLGFDFDHAVSSARSSAKKTIRALVRLEEHGVNVPAILGRFVICCATCFSL